MQKGGEGSGGGDPRAVGGEDEGGGGDGVGVRVALSQQPHHRRLKRQEVRPHEVVHQRLGA